MTDPEFLSYDAFGAELGKSKGYPLFFTTEPEE